MRLIRAKTRDMTDGGLRRAALALRYTGKNLPMAITDTVIHPNRPNEYTVLRYDTETRREAAARLRQWAWGREL